MADNKKNPPHRSLPKDDEELLHLFANLDPVALGEQEDDEGGKGGKTGEIEFRDKGAFLGQRRDDLLPPEELRRLLMVHKEVHKGRVEKQKHTREQRAAQKEGRYVPPRQQQTRGLGGGGSAAKHSNHPLLSAKPQFDGIDKQLVGVPNKNEADTNPEAREALEERLENKLRNAPRFNPRPQFPG